MITAFVMYLPFYVGFDSQAGGIIPNFMYPDTRCADLGDVGYVVHPALCLFDLFLAKQEHLQIGARACLPRSDFVLVLLGAMFAIGFLAWKFKPDLVQSILEVAMPRRWWVHRSQYDASIDIYRWLAYIAGFVDPHASRFYFDLRTAPRHLFY